MPRANIATGFVKHGQRRGKKLDLGKACLRFKKVEDLALDVIGDAIKRVPAAKYIEFYEAARAGTPTRAKKARA